MAGLINFLKTVSSTSRKVSGVLGAVGGVTSALGGLGSALGISSLARLGGLPAGAEETYESYTPVSWSSGSKSTGNDWRVRLHLPTSLSSFMSSPILQPLYDSNNSMVFPTTPQILVTHAANYNNLSPTHTNYSYPIYQNSSVEDITITAEFPVENEADGRYWIAAVHFLRSATKMFYGNSSNLGAPPPLVHLSGYGDFVFNKTPVVIKLFTLDLPDSVDYLQVPISTGLDLSSVPELTRVNVPGGYSYVPTLSRLNVTVSPAYSRDTVRRFSLDTYVRGGYIGGGKGII
jgi:hypothetical protein|tara:strand:- start:396 stop:1265 length:870 start_codon:yes stop_codon:yes gene_type:complete